MSAWCERLSIYLLGLGFAAKQIPHCLFLILSWYITHLVYVDDIIVIESNSSVISTLVTLLGKELSSNDLGKIHYFLGIEVIYHNNSLLINQTRNSSLLNRELILDCKPRSTPLSPTHHPQKADNSSILSDVKSYRSIVGALQYLTTRRPDLTYAVNLVCQYMHLLVQGFCETLIMF